MCRLFALFSTSPVDVSASLYKAPQSLLVQSQANPELLQGDGWGVGWFEQGQPRVRKSPKPIFEERALVRRVAKDVKGSSAVAHVRWASNPLKLPREVLIGPAHTQPFVHGPYLFVHNGTLQIPLEVRAALGPWASFVQGQNDSEVLFYWLLKYLTPVLEGRETPDPAALQRALRNSVRGLDDLFDECRQTYPLYKAAYHGVNVVLTNGVWLLAFCFVNREGFDKNKALCNRSQPYYQLQKFVRPKSVAIASEPLDPDQPWEPFAHGQWLLATRRRGAIDLEEGQIL